MDTGEIRSLFFKALEVDASERPAFLQKIAAPEVRQALQTLLRHDAGGETFLREAVSHELASPTAEGRRFGAYEIRELLGRGGMGAVFRAERIDGELLQVVAIKIVERGWLAPHALERFRQERQILAGLIHPNIAQLLDGGTTEDGVPYLVMEFVDGLPLHQYCQQKELGLAGSLQVFLPLCDAVEYAHRKLVVHRDLKPSNVLVTAEGAPKLLDFGVAKAIGSGAGGQTQTLVLTPDFASPEQVLGEEVTTATDVYGLGAVLYHLLTGHSPHPVRDLSPAELRRAICEVGPARPSLHRPELRGDLENILLKALHPEPASRYRSVRELADDIVRYRELRPVQATSRGWWYPTRRFLQRHAIPSAAAGLALLAVAAATGVSLYEARRAEQRFSQVRELANRFIFDFETSIRDVPGTLAARRMVADTARKYLASLAADNQRDTGLTRELAESHYRLSRVEINAGQTVAALDDNEKAVALLRSVKADCCGSPADRMLFIRALVDLARQRQTSRETEGALKLSTEAAANAREWIARSPQQPEAQQALTLALATQGVNQQAAGKLTEAYATLTEAVQWGARVVSQNPRDETLAYEQARATHFLGGVCLSLRKGDEAGAYGRAAAETLGHLVTRHPDNAKWRNMQAMAVSTEAAGYDLLAEKNPAMVPRSVEASRNAYSLALENLRLNPTERDEADTASVLATRLAAALDRAQRFDEAERLVMEAGVIDDRLVRNDPTNVRNQRLRLADRVVLGDMQLSHRAWGKAARTLAEAETYIEEFLVRHPNDWVTTDLKVSVLVDQAILRRQEGNSPGARDLCRQGLNIAAAIIRRDPAKAAAFGDLDKLRLQAKELGLDDPTLESAGEAR